MYTTREVELSSADEGSDDFEDESSEEEEEGEEEEEDEEEEEKTKNDAEDEEPVLAQSFRACVVSLDELDLKVVGSRPSPPSPSQALQLRVEQMEEIDLSPDLTTAQQEQAKALLWEYRDCFANNLEELGNTDIVEHEINLKPGAHPFYCPGIKHFAPKELEFIRADVEKELAAGKIVEFDGPWCAPITLAMKKEGTYRKCVAYNGLNDRTE